LSFSESWDLARLALCIVCWSASVSTHLVVHQRSTIWMLGISQNAHGRAWNLGSRLAGQVIYGGRCRTVRRLARRKEIYLLQSLAGQAGLPRLYCDLRCCLRQEQNTRWPRGLESRARRLGSSTSVLLSKHRVFHHKFSDIACVLRQLRDVISNH